MNYFSEKELKCPHCDTYHFNIGTLGRLNQLREQYRKPIIINSGYRCEEYNKLKGYTQTHATGQAVDINVNRADAYNLLRLALNLGFTGIGIKQKGIGRFLHLDDLRATDKILRPTIWSY